ncbi:large subunit ribosomal protein L24e_1, cytoplasmic [Guillardia theta CCMP2712]|uniref:Large subunit ribosomal protein L24e_1, cytoplasmic n=1 Tax=Guillardia theta (strain CCMP2712) TaxID=905079 RepID=L1JDE8_GUITC|nr:large subunit ribosomal protein L24e_1, cytoplasmic [Guillardia theta CCMP2712]EKX46568.1 large subunit ribosomal protein L24e_1, cytoplasmic [Guillardia theta CCMP2712]|mmetsp:Transcript_25997/g.85542  ORF Transcript_25997/g.85542 Transcript_25997/m.85542 type:complete len:170 (-) Transcript_25997:2526-3035(-)|eukprot:XP_005833548.1 large subunit ribosomal protein L24e_1, cytoplasmic [Guillardia theta CCMP2712]
MVVKTETCTFSNFRIYPGHGCLYIRTDGKSFRFINAKNEASFHMKRNPRKLNWTLFYRRLRKKGTQEDQLKKAKKRVISTSVLSRGIQGMTIEELKNKTSEGKERRKAMREATVREAKDAARKKQEEKKKNAPAKKAAPAGNKMDVKGTKGGANLKPARQSAPGKQGAR